MRTTTIIIIMILALIVTSKADSYNCYELYGEMYCDSDSDAEEILEEIRETQEKILEEQERANMEAEFYREYNSE